MSTTTQKAYGIQRLESKTAKAAIIQKIAADFNLMPLIAEAYYMQISTYFEQHADVKLTSGQICYEAVAADEPAGKHIALARKVDAQRYQLRPGDFSQLRSVWVEETPRPAVNQRSLRPECFIVL